MTRTIEDDLRDYGEAYEINGERIDPTSVEVFANLVTYCTPDGRHTQCARSEMVYHRNRVNYDLGKPYVTGMKINMVTISTPPAKDMIGFMDYQKKFFASVAEAYGIDYKEMECPVAKIMRENAKLYFETPSGEIESIGEIGKLSFPSFSGEHVKALKEAGGKFTMSGAFEPTEEWQAFVKSVRREALFRWLETQVPSRYSVSYHALMTVGGF